MVPIVDKLLLCDVDPQLFVFNRSIAINITHLSAL